ncbi:MAG: family 10 glycosylhydrolase [Fidelibacterota bacterium]
MNTGQRLFFIFSFLVYTLSGQTANQEFRATWVITWEHINPSDTPAQGKARIRQIMDNHKAANMTSVLFQVRQSGTAYYNSSFEPWGYYADYSDPGYDPLAYAIEQAHARGLELHAWFNVFQASSMHPGAPSYEHPEWVCRDRDGIPMDSYRSLSPGLDSVRAYLVDVAMEIVNNYDIDGLHLDYVRWNEYTNTLRQIDMGGQVEEIGMLDGIITEDMINELNNNRSGRYLYDVEHPYSAGVPSGFSSWEEWWRWSVTEFVQTLHDSIQAVKPHVRLTAAVLGKYNWSGWQGYGTVYQDAALWFNEGYVDQLTPMHYHWTTPNGFYNMLVGPNGQSNSAECWGTYIQPGIAAGRLYSVGPGSYMLEDYGVWNNHPAIVNICRTVPWVDGFQFFSYGKWDYHDYWVPASNLFFNTRTKIRPVPGNPGTAPPAPVLNLTAINSLTYNLTITPGDSTTSTWFALYRSPDDTLDPTIDEIIQVHFGDSTFTVTQSFDGTQDFNGQYHYAVTQLDRYWNESPLSTIVVTDSIPSFPPVVTSSNPAEGDTIPVNVVITLHFSKTLDITTVPDALSLEPSVDFFPVFSNNHKSFSLSNPNLEYNTAYTFTVDSTLTDINGAPLDGNGDGIGGDSFILHFHTEVEDTHGPLVTESNLTFGDYTPNVDVEEVLNIVFDELIDETTLSPSSVVLQENTTAITYEWLHTTLNDRSILNLRLTDGFSPNTDYTITLDQTITDLLGNPMIPTTAAFHTRELGYTEITDIDPFSSVNNWKEPSWSGSTVGILAGTEFGTSTQVYLPGTSPAKAARLAYVWDMNATDHLLREYLSGGPPRAVEFDTSYTLQVYIYGDGSYNLFRFAVDDHLPATAAEYHEVSPWYTIDWTGWRLVEWDLGSDPVGSWIGNGILEGTMRIDSFQLTYETGAAPTGTIYFDNLRIVKKGLLATQPPSWALPEKYSLGQNYPNPFNPTTTIPYSLPKDSHVRLSVYDLLGRHIVDLINTFQTRGEHKVTWDGRDAQGNQVSSGMYLYRLESEDFVANKRMLFLK